MDDRVEWALMRAALWDEVKGKLRQSGDSLSGGQQQRLCIARGIAIKPEVLLLDEPCSALDPISTAKIEELIHELKSDYTVVIFQFAMIPYADWHRLAWGGAALITLAVLALNVAARVAFRRRA